MVQHAEPTADALRVARRIAWGSFFGGTVVSVAANVEQARMTPPKWAIAPDGGMHAWSPEVGPQIAAAFWPLALLAAVEVMTRIPWPNGRGWVAARFGGVGLVAAGAAIISYTHMLDLLEMWSYTGLPAHLGPLVVDGLMVVSGAALFAMSSSNTALVARLSGPPTRTDPPPPGRRHDEDEYETSAGEEPTSRVVDAGEPPPVVDPAAATVTAEHAASERAVSQARTDDEPEDNLSAAFHVSSQGPDDGDAVEGETAEGDTAAPPATGGDPGLTPEEKREAAIGDWVAALAGGIDPDDFRAVADFTAEIATRYGFSDRWARNQKYEAQRRRETGKLKIISGGG